MALLRHGPSSKADDRTTTSEKVARRKPSLLELASNLDNVSKACKPMGYSRQQFYEILRDVGDVVKDQQIATVELG